VNDAICHRYNFYHQKIQTGCVEEGRSWVRCIVWRERRVERHFWRLQLYSLQIGMRFGSGSEIKRVGGLES